MVISNLKFSNGGGGAFWSKIPERGFLENLDKNLLFEECVQKPACALQIVSYMWRLIKLCTERCYEQFRMDFVAYSALHILSKLCSLVKLLVSEAD